MLDQENPWFLDASSFERVCEASLRRLEVKCIDLYLLTAMFAHFIDNIHLKRLQRRFAQAVSIRRAQQDHLR